MGPLRYLLQMYHTTNHVMSISISVVFAGKKISNSNRAKDTVHIDNPLYELFRSIQFHIIDRYETYTLAKLRNFHQYKTTTEEKSVKLRSIDLKNKLKNEQFCQINCLKFY